MLLFRMMEEAQTPQETLFEHPDVRPSPHHVPAAASCSQRRFALLSADQRVASSHCRAAPRCGQHSALLSVRAKSTRVRRSAIMMVARSARGQLRGGEHVKRFIDVFTIAGRSDAAGQRGGDLGLTSVHRIELASCAGSLSLVDGLALVDHENGRFAFTVVDPHSGSILKQQPRPKGDSPADAADCTGGAADARTAKAARKFWKGACLGFTAVSSRYVALGGNNEGGPKLCFYDLFQPCKAARPEGSSGTSRQLVCNARLGACPDRHVDAGRRHRRRTKSGAFAELISAAGGAGTAQGAPCSAEAAAR